MDIEETKVTVQTFNDCQLPDCQWTQGQDRVKIESEEDAMCISPGSWWSCETEPDISVAGFESPALSWGFWGEET